MATEVDPLPGPRCGHGATAAEHTLRVRLLIGRSLDGGDLARHTRAAQRYFASYGVRLENPAGDAVRVDIPAAFAARPQRQDMAAVAAPLRRIITDHARSAGNQIVVALLRDIVPPGSPLAARLPRLAGLTLSPALDRAVDPEGELRGALKLGDHAPVVLLSTRALATLPPGERQTALAHELGHALGLAHHDDDGNLMARRRQSGCVPVLEPGQLARFPGPSSPRPRPGR